LLVIEPTKQFTKRFLTPPIIVEYLDAKISEHQVDMSELKQLLALVPE
jgi:hypothetical protein